MIVGYKCLLFLLLTFSYKLTKSKFDREGLNMSLHGHKVESLGVNVIDCCSCVVLENVLSNHVLFTTLARYINVLFSQTCP
jgi:hypothetical protein